MKTIVKTSRLAGSLEKLFAKLNNSFFNGELEMPVITIQSTPRAYGHYTKYNAWEVDGEGRREINIGAGTLDREIEYTVATMIHEMCHMYADTVLHVQDTSNHGVYHNKVFKAIAESHGLICTRSEKYGWSDTSSVISDDLIEWILANDVQEIKLSRNDIPEIPAGKATGTGKTATDKPKAGRPKSHKYRCNCGDVISSSSVDIQAVCAKCATPFVKI